MMHVALSPTSEQDFLRRAIQRSEKALAHAQFTLVAVATRLANQRREYARSQQQKEAA